MVFKHDYACWDCVELCKDWSSHEREAHAAVWYTPTLIPRAEFESLLDKHREIFFTRYINEVQR